METPNITQAQLLAAGQAVLAVLVSFGVNLTDAQQASLLGLSAVLTLVLGIGDAIIRHGRSRALSAPPAPATLAAGGGDETDELPGVTSSTATRAAIAPRDTQLERPPATRNTRLQAGQRAG